MEFIFGLAGVLLGAMAVLIAFRIQSAGTLRIDHSDEDGPYLFLELKKGVRDISNKKMVVLMVRREDFLPHK